MLRDSKGCRLAVEIAAQVLELNDEGQYHTMKVKKKLLKHRLALPLSSIIFLLCHALRDTARSLHFKFASRGK